mmetsp:Transcript_8102/g.15033  ORF Transcript_8102/g.15033 Transcript_8102/m.15033 type:complete len:244 (+) Transcript_8102:121-852(+)|eukprot:CAMPEP_0197534448 /NCGR_PEP_ID=MMETSP1318-20131121/47223_1 /TAXON_ID=552666 /ORGANISM="Partenskyella glossopodia, Strain RCC365" /LENGTH=243 /DNA_ID=CAMNT_0043091729 /DNA_START=82 /DNA_END=813 /DNA_ORIENTATION=+
MHRWMYKIKVAGVGLKSRGSNFFSRVRKFSDQARENARKIGFIDWYLGQLEARPVVTKSITSAIIGGFGDILCQKAVEKRENIDFQRNAKFTFLGLVMVGPILHNWFGFLNKYVTLPGTQGVLVRLALDQTVFAAGFLSLFLGAVQVLDGKPENVKPMLEAEWWPAMKANWKLWIPANFINFSFVQPRLQVLFANSVAVIWNVYLSMASHRGEDDADHEKEVQVLHAEPALIENADNKSISNE